MPQRFGRYWLQEKIGRGGMAEIFRATIGPKADTYAFELAIKRLLTELENDPKQVGMFLTEADIAKFLRHPNLVQVYEAGSIEGHVYIAMEYIWGHDLARLIENLRRRRLLLPPEMSVYIAMQVLRALDYVHQAKNARGDRMAIVHRDVTPSNVYVTFRGEVKLGDFGIAQVKLQSAEEANVLKGKVHYMPPEVIAGKPVTFQVDLWSLAVTLYEMLTGRPLHEGVTDAQMMAGQYPKKVVPAHKVNPAIDPGLSRILSRALHTNVNKRPANAALFYRELKFFLAERGLPADAASLSRFVRAGLGMSTTESSKQQTASGEFENPEYQAPIEFSPTQRYEMSRRRRTLGPSFAAAAVLTVLAAGGGVYVARHRQNQALAAHKAADDAVLDGALLDGADDASRQQARALLRTGVEQLKGGTYDGAAQTFRQAVALQPHNATAQLGLARALYEMGSYDDAEKLALSVIAADPKNVRAHFLLGSIFRAAGDAERANQSFQRCVTLDPDGQFGKSASQVLSEQ